MKLTRNILTLLRFEGVYKLLIVVLAVPFLNALENLAMWLTGYQYISMENLKRFCRHPVTVVIILLTVLLIMLLMLIDFCAVIYNLHAGYHGVKTNLTGTILFSLRQTAAVIRRGSKLWLAAAMIVLLPVFGIGVFPVLQGNILIQEMIIRQLRSRRNLIILAAAAGICLALLFLRWMYTFQIRILEDCDMKQAIRRSTVLGKGRHIKDLGYFLLTQACCYLAYVLFLGISMLLALLLERLFGNTSFINPVSSSVLLTLTTIAMILLGSISAPAGCLCIASLYYRHMGEDQEAVPGLQVLERSKENDIPPSYRRALAVTGQMILLVCISACAVYLFLSYRGRMNPNIEYLHQTEITAHRGASRYYPENTMAAFRGALDEGADWIELDIHQSKDSLLYVMHDAYLYRTCGVKKYGWDCTWDELADMSAGLKFGKSFHNEKIPLLSEVIDFALETGIRLNIEIKPSFREEGIERNLVDLLHEKDFTQQCVVTSQKYESLKKVKELDGNITTVYVMQYAYGDIDLLEAADHFSINTGSITKRLVRRLHNKGRQIYAWTVNSRVNIESMIEKNVDNIITDDIRLANRIIGQSYTGTALQEYIRWLRQWFR